MQKLSSVKSEVFCGFSLVLLLQTQESLMGPSPAFRQEIKIYFSTFSAKKETIKFIMAITVKIKLSIMFFSGEYLFFISKRRI